MQRISWYTDFALTNSAGSTTIGTYDSVEISSPGAYDRKILENAESEEIAKVYIFNFSTIYPNLSGAQTKMPISSPDTADTQETAPLHTLYTQGKTRLDYKYYTDSNGISHFWLNYPVVYTYRLEALPYTYGSTDYQWIESASWDTASFSLDGVYFFSGIYTHDVYGTDITEEIVIPTCIVHPNADPNTNIYAGTKRGYSISIIQGYNVEHYVPTGNNTRLGGSGTGHYNGAMPETLDIAARNAAFAITSGNGNGLTYYLISAQGLQDIISFLYGHHLIDDIQKYLNCVVGCHILPILYVPTTPDLGRVFISNRTVSVDSAHILGTRLVTGSMGSADLSNSGYDDYNDFSNTRASLYLPYVGRITIDINAIARGLLDITYAIDLYNGNISYWVYTTSKDADIPILYGTYTGNCACEIPLCGSGPSGNTLGKILNAGSAIATGFAESKMKGALEIYNAAQSFSDRVVNKSGANDVNSICLVPYQARLDIERIEAIRADSAPDIVGVPGYDTKTLGELSGFIKVISADLSGIVCEQSERDELERLLESGVYI